MEDEDDERPSYPHHIHRKLNFNAPLLTTRRSGGGLGPSGAGRRLSSTSDRVPFSWEKAPGKPKEYDERCDDDDAVTPRPTLPPGWWRPHVQTSWVDERGSSRRLQRKHEGCDGNVDGGEDDYNNSSGGYVISDTVDVLSLSEAIDIVEKAEKAHKFSDELKLKQMKYEEEEEERSNGYNLSSNFMMERFLPDATALAAASALNLDALSCSYRQTGCISPQRVARPPFSPPKGCGLDVLFPWRTKHQLCGVKSPVRHSTRSLGSKSSAKQKKQH